MQWQYTPAPATNAATRIAIRVYDFTFLPPTAEESIREFLISI
jgi:hypothetical protein